MLFKKLYNQGKQIAKGGVYSAAERKQRITLESSINETYSKILDLSEQQKIMLCEIEKFDHIKFCTISKEIVSHKQSLYVLCELANKLFGLETEQYFSIESVWDFIEEELNEKNSSEKDK